MRVSVFGILYFVPCKRTPGRQFQAVYGPDSKSLKTFCLFNFFDAKANKTVQHHQGGPGLSQGHPPPATVFSPFRPRPLLPAASHRDFNLRPAAFPTRVSQTTATATALGFCTDILQTQTARRGNSGNSIRMDGCIRALAVSRSQAPSLSLLTFTVLLCPEPEKLPCWHASADARFQNHRRLRVVSTTITRHVVGCAGNLEK